MKMRLMTYDMEPEHIPVDVPDRPRVVEEWFGNYLAHTEAVERALAVVLRAATDHQFAQLAAWEREKARVLDAAIDVVLDAAPPAVLAHFDALCAARTDG